MDKNKFIASTIFFVFFFCIEIFSQDDFQINSEIESIFRGMNNDEVFGEIAEIYKKHRNIFLEERSNNTLTKRSKVDSIIYNSNISQEFQDMIITYWKKGVDQFRIETIQRDSSRKNALKCLKKVYKNELANYKNIKNELSPKFKNILPENELKRIRKKSNLYLSRVTRIQNNFREVEEIYYGEIGANLTLYNQISFDLIKKIISSQYGRILEQYDKAIILEIYNNNPKLEILFEQYSKSEFEVVNAITAEDCFKRIGILRFYDGLNESQIKDTQIINMMLNLAK